MYTEEEEAGSERSGLEKQKSSVSPSFFKVLSMCIHYCRQTDVVACCVCPSSSSIVRLLTFPVGFFLPPPPDRVVEGGEPIIQCCFQKASCGLLSFFSLSLSHFEANFSSCPRFLLCVCVVRITRSSSSSSLFVVAKLVRRRRRVLLFVCA